MQGLGYVSQRLHGAGGPALIIKITKGMLKGSGSGECRESSISYKSAALFAHSKRGLVVARGRLACAVCLQLRCSLSAAQPRVVTGATSQQMKRPQQRRMPLWFCSRRPEGLRW